MRKEEGKAMTEELRSHQRTIAAHLDAIRQKTPQIVAAFRDRLLERVRKLLQDVDVQIDRDTVIREVAMFAERSDIAEEVIRLATHLDHFLEIMKEKDGPGRKLEFLVQEMSRETNTIGSKASDVGVSKDVVSIKHTLEQVRELIQNVECDSRVREWRMTPSTNRRSLGPAAAMRCLQRPSRASCNA